MQASFELQDNECGDGALEVSEELDFELTVSVDGDEIKWNADEMGTSLTGVVSADSFLITSSKVVSEGNDCSILVNSRYSGTFDQLGGSISDMDGELVVSYEASDSGACRWLVGASDGFDRLPCAITYTFDLDPMD